MVHSSHGQTREKNKLSPKKLDHVMVNDQWLRLFPQSYNVVTELEGFRPMVEQHWQETEPIFLSTSSVVILEEVKIPQDESTAACKGKIGNLSVKAKEAYDDLCVKQKKTIRNPSTQSLEQENLAYARWEHVSRLEGFLKQKSKLH